MYGIAYEVNMKEQDRSVDTRLRNHVLDDLEKATTEKNLVILPGSRMVVKSIHGNMIRTTITTLAIEPGLVYDSYQ